VPQDHEDTVIGVAQLLNLLGLVLVQRAHQVASHDQSAAPDDKFEPLGKRNLYGDILRRGRLRKDKQSCDQQNAGERCERRVPPPVEIGGPQRGQHEKAQDHPLRSNQMVQDERNDEQGENHPEFLVHRFEAAQHRRFHMCIS
jgi:hypothetical protein